MLRSGLIRNVMVGSDGADGRSRVSQEDEILKITKMSVKQSSHVIGGGQMRSRDLQRSPGRPTTSQTIT